eukprot:6594623-Prymnesium_polylepis.1
MESARAAPPTALAARRRRPPGPRELGARQLLPDGLQAALVPACPLGVAPLVAADRVAHVREGLARVVDRVVALPRLRRVAHLAR